MALTTEQARQKYMGKLVRGRGYVTGNRYIGIVFEVIERSESNPQARVAPDVSFAVSLKINTTTRIDVRRNIVLVGIEVWEG